MFAIVNIAGQQFKVKQNDELFVHRLSGNAGDRVEFSNVLMVGGEGNITVGSNSKKVQAEILDHLKGDKVIVFKKKRRKGYQKKKWSPPEPDKDKNKRNSLTLTRNK